MKKTILIRLAIGAGSLMLILFVTLVAHIALVTSGKQNDKRERQLARIDFIQDIDPSQAAAIKQTTLQIPGVDGAFVNESTNILVYSFNPAVQNSDMVFNTVTKILGHPARKYTVSESDLKNGCPAGYERNLVSRFALYTAQLFQ